MLENTEDLTIRKNNGELLKSIVKQVGFQIRTYNNTYSVYIDSNSIALHNIDLIDGTVSLIKTVEVEPTEETPGTTRKRKTFEVQINDIPLYVDPDNIFEDPTAEKDIKYVSGTISPHGTRVSPAGDKTILAEHYTTDGMYIVVPNGTVLWDQISAHYVADAELDTDGTVL